VFVIGDFFGGLPGQRRCRARFDQGIVQGAESQRHVMLLPWKRSLSAGLWPVMVVGLPRWLDTARMTHPPAHARAVAMRNGG
jgi:hypothetical protein